MKSHDAVRTLDPARFEKLAPAILRPDLEGKGFVVDCESPEFQAFKLFPMSEPFKAHVEVLKKSYPTVEDLMKRDGPRLWGRMHRNAWMLEVEPFAEVVVQIIRELPCGECKGDAVEYVKANPIPRGAPELRARWSNGFQNHVNAKLGKPLVSFEDARERWAPVPVIIEHSEGLGDNVVFSGTLRDLHAAHPGRFVTDVRGAWNEIYENNPHVTRLAGDDEKRAKVVKHYSYGNRWNDRAHLAYMHSRGLEQELGVEIPLRSLAGDIHLSDAEKSAPPIVEGPYWVFAAGHKPGWSVKMWPPEHFQKVVDHFAGRITFVQASHKSDPSYRLQRVVHLDTQPLRELIRAVYYADGVLATVSHLMHLAAAVPSAPGKPRGRACVVLAGGRENPNLTQYATHTQLSRIGKLDCCVNGGCWRTEVSSCAHPRRSNYGLQVPQCMWDVTPEAVIAEIESRYDGKELIVPLEEKSSRIVDRAKIAKSMTSDGDLRFLAELVIRENAKTALEIGSFHGRSACVLLFAGVKELYCVDDFVGVHDLPGSRIYDGIEQARESFQRCAAGAAEETGSKLRLFDVDSLNEAGQLRVRLRVALDGGKLDLAWIDGNHSYDAVLADIETATEFLRPGGVCCGHDYHFIPEVKRAVDECFGRAVRTSGDVWWVRT